MRRICFTVVCVHTVYVGTDAQNSAPSLQGTCPKLRLWELMSEKEHSPGSIVSPNLGAATAGRLSREASSPAKTHLPLSWFQLG